ncbi:hypothetical protein AVEN_71554-1 [Araneus ventricosus]|uniref:Uncharacterized protein n=1 Tax=Araneus ventricosus TaxID=182803 RepID=A0A4Y2EUV8_ARAVE|nr:hypothetical protein AVEN_71554-1 [Araneus ventricosus]
MSEIWSWHPNCTSVFSLGSSRLEGRCPKCMLDSPHNNTKIYTKSVILCKLMRNPERASSINKWDCGGLAVRSRLRGRRFRGSKPDSTEGLPCMWDCCTLNYM